VKNYESEFWASVIVAVVTLFMLTVATITIWNFIMPEIGLQEINFWQALCLTWLCYFIFKPSPKTRKE